MDIDKLFKLPKLPSSSTNKRKWAEPTADNLKAYKPDLDTDASSLSHSSEDGARVEMAPPGPSAGPARPPSASIADEDDEEEENEDFAPGNDADYFVEEDAEGRFFGGGLTDQQKRILEIMNSGDPDENDDEKSQSNDLGTVRKQLLRFERAINKNQELRVKFADEPQKFIDSEADLDAELKGLVLLTTNPGLFYPEMLKLGTVASLAGLLSHENIDIAIAVIEVIEELTDDDVLDAGEDGIEEGEERKGEEAMRLLADALIENQILDLLAQNLHRLNDVEESDGQGMFHTLGVIENLVSFRPSLADTLVSSTDLLDWLLKRVRKKGPYDQNKGYASEILAILMQSSVESRKRLGKEGGIDALLGVLAQFRRRDPADADEAEFMENLFDTLCSCLSEAENKKRFLEGEGVELMVIIMKEKRVSRMRSIKVLDHALSGSAGLANCERFVEALGLKTLFSAFMGKGSKKHDAAALKSEDDEHMLGIMVSLLNNLASDSAPRIRLLSKFVEDEYSKVDRLLELRENNEGRVTVAERGIEAEKKELLDDGEELTEEEEEVFYLRRLESGLFTLQMVDYILAWVCMEDDGIRSHVKVLLERKGKSFDDVIKVLKEYYHNIGDEVVGGSGAASNGAEGSSGEDSDSKESRGELKQKDIIVELVNFLLGIDA